MRRVAVLVVGVLVAAGSAGAQAHLPLRDTVPSVVASTAAPALTWDDGVEDAAGAPISTTRAVLYSLLIPGLGDYKLGNHGRATAFFIAEGVIWVSYAVFEVQGNQREDEYQDLTVRFAGVTRTGHSDDFYATLREFDTSEEYEADVKLDGRNELVNSGGLEALNADALERYFVENRLEDYEPWQWASVDRKLQYSEVRSSSKTSYRRADYMIAAAAANRVVSAIVTYAAGHNANRQPTVGYRFNVVPGARGVDVAFTLTRSF